MWRVNGDICSSWYFQTQSPSPLDKDCTVNSNHNVHEGVVDYISYISANPEIGWYTFPGHFADEDMLEVGNLGLTFDEAKSQFSMWAMFSSPLLAGNDPASLSYSGYDVTPILLNNEIIAIDQDSSAVMAEEWLIQNGIHIWVKPLANGSRAIAFVNLNDSAASTTISWQSVGLNQPNTIRDPWGHKDISPISTFSTGMIPPHGISVIVVNGQ